MTKVRRSRAGDRWQQPRTADSTVPKTASHGTDLELILLLLVSKSGVQAGPCRLGQRRQNDNLVPLAPRSSSGNTSHSWKQCGANNVQKSAIRGQSVAVPLYIVLVLSFRTYTTPPWYRYGIWEGRQTYDHLGRLIIKRHML